MIPSALVALIVLVPQGSDELPSAHVRMVATLKRMADEAAKDNPFFGSAQLDADLDALKQAGDDKPKQRWKLERDLGFQQLKLGLVDESIASYTRAYDIQQKFGKALGPQEQIDTWFDLGLAYLRLGETRNCVDKHCKASCIFPIQSGGMHGDPLGSRKAIEMFAKVLARQPDRWAARWLTNIAYMTLGEYPDKVPEALRIPLTPFDSGVLFPRFPDVAQDLGLDKPSLAGGIVVGDFDGDGVLDLVNSNWGAADPTHFWKGLGGGKFEERSHEAGLDGITGGLNLTYADYDNDGDLDLFVLRGAWMRAHGRWPNSLLQNDGHGHFVDVTYDVGLAEPMYPTQAGAWGDYDNDGDLDLFIGNESSVECAAPSQLFRNDGGKFVDVAVAAGVTNNRYAKGATWGDYDNDRYLDLYVSNNGEPNRLYHNKRDGTFEDVTDKCGVAAPALSFSTWFFDYDNDGALDLFVASYYPFVEPYVAWAAGVQMPFEPKALYKGDGKGGFRNVTAEVGLVRPNCTMGSSFGDFDDDGFLDFYLATGYPGYDGLMPNLAFWNRGGKSFADVTVPSGMGHLQKGHGVAFLDYDGDGDLDVYEDLGGAFPGDAYSTALFQNPGFGNHWIEVELTGTKSNRCAIGARIRVDVREGDAKRSIFRTVNCGSSFGGNPLRQHIGVGKAEKIDALEIYWSTSDSKQTFKDVAVGKLVRITEGETSLR